MDALNFMKKFGAEEAERVSHKAGTTFGYFKQIAYGHRRPSPELADKLEIASGKRLEFRALLSTRRKGAVALKRRKSRSGELREDQAMPK